MSDIMFFDPLLFKCPKGVITKGESVTFWVKCSENVDANFGILNGLSESVKMKTSATEEASVVLFCVKMDGEGTYKELAMERTHDGNWKIDYKFDCSGHYFYHFLIFQGEKKKYLCKNYLNFSCETDSQGEDFFQSVLEKKYNCSNSLQGGILYQIFADRFCKVGDVKVRKPLIMREDWGGKIKKNTADPLVINRETFGGNLAGVRSKLGFLKELGVTVIYFNPICMANSNHKYDTADYGKIDPMLGTDEEFEALVREAKNLGIKILIDGVYNHTGSDSIYFNKLNNFDTVGAFNSKASKYYSWYDFKNWPNEYSSWWGIDTLPSIKEPCEPFEEYIAGKGGIIEKYMKMGVFGVRLDVVDELKDEFVKSISNKVHEFGEDAVVMGEVWEDASTKISYSKRRTYFAQNELNSVMNYPVKESILNFVKTKEPTDLVSTIRMLQNNYPKEVQDNLMNFLGTHDTNRIFTELENIAGGDKDRAKRLYKICMCLVFTMSGVPSIFYGDEYGMENNDDSSRGCYDWENYKNDLFEWMMKLTKIRKLEVFKDGELNILYARNGKFIYERKAKMERVIVGVNLKDTPITLELDGKYENFFTAEKLQNRVTLKENDFIILLERRVRTRGASSADALFEKSIRF